LNRSLSPQTIEIIKNSANLVTSNDILITKRMYEIMFSKYPHFKKQFNNTPEDQYMKLAEAISAYAMNIEKIERLKPALQIIAKIHVKRNVLPSQYFKVGGVLLEAMEEVLGDRASLEFLDAWREVYNYIAKILIDMESELCRKKVEVKELL